MGQSRFIRLGEEWFVIGYRRLRLLLKRPKSVLAHTHECGTFKKDYREFLGCGKA